MQRYHVHVRFLQGTTGPELFACILPIIDLPFRFGPAKKLGRIGGAHQFLTYLGGGGRGFPRYVIIIPESSGFSCRSNQVKEAGEAGKRRKEGDIPLRKAEKPNSFPSFPSFLPVI